MTNTTPETKQKKKGIIRWEAIVPFTIVCAVIALYFHFFFDTHLRKALEWAGYSAVGAEVNIANLETSFFKASLLIQGIEVTDAEKPTHNSIKIGDIRFSVLWDALLRAKFVVNEAAVEQIEFGSLRKKPGKVKPPEPAKDGQPGLSEKLKEQALQEAQGQAGDNVLGDVISMLGGSDAEAQLQKLQTNLPAKAMLEKFDAELKQKQQGWDARLKTLPQEKDIRALNDRLNKIKYQNFKDAQELQASIQELDKVIKDGDAMYKQVQGTSDDLGKDLKAVETQYRDIEKQVQIDIKTLEQHFRIPQLDAKAMTAAVFNRYLAPYKSKFYRYKELADKYMPPNLKKKNKDGKDTIVQPHPREDGISYEFARANSYPLFWVKRTAVSSQAGTTPEAGNIKGEILDITSNQRLTGKPTVASLAGDFPGMEIFGFLTRLSLDNTKDQSEIDYKLKVDTYAIAGKELVQTPEVQIAFNKATGGLDVEGKVIGLKNIILAMNNKFTNVDYLVKANNDVANQILNAVFKGIPTVTLSVKGQGEFPNVPLNINSNLGPELQKGFEKQLQAKVNEARARIQALVNEELGKQRAQVEAQLKQLRGQFDGEVKKAQAQLEGQRKQAESRVDQAKKDAENQGRKQLEKEGQKALDQLKEKFGF